MTLIQSAKINGLDPQAYLRDVLERLPAARLSDLDDLLPHNWTPTIKV
jgi:transposase